MQKGIKTRCIDTSQSPFRGHDPTAEMQKGIKTLRWEKVWAFIVYDPTAEMQKGIKTCGPRRTGPRRRGMTRPQKCKRGWEALRKGKLLCLFSFGTVVLWALANREGRGVEGWESYNTWMTRQQKCKRGLRRVKSMGLEVDHIHTWPDSRNAKGDETR